MSEQAQANMGDALGVPGCKNHYRVTRIISPIELKKFKKDFLSLSKLHPPKGSKADAFLDFLNARLKESE